MADRKTRRDAGYSKWLDCPVCEEPCRTLSPYSPDDEYPFPHWEDGDKATCQCGAKLVVSVIENGERARLVNAEAEDVG